VNYLNYSLFAIEARCQFKNSLASGKLKICDGLKLNTKAFDHLLRLPEAEKITVIIMQYVIQSNQNVDIDFIAEGMWRF
jgi:hypothetical protein